jgi:predicted transcriptional regulator
MNNKCPVCNLSVSGEKGLSLHFAHRQKANDIKHIEYQQQQELAYWANKIENEDYVICKICGYKSDSIVTHLTKTHKITAGNYRNQVGQDALVRSFVATRNMSEAAKNRKDTGKGATKDITCPDCQIVWVGSKFLVPETHDLRCQSCKQKAEDAKWVNLKEPEDYCTCKECGYRAESLISHLQHNHPDYWQKYPEAIVVALKSAIRDKTELRGKSLSDETKQKMSNNAGRWNKGLTKETDSRVAVMSEHMQNRPSWNKGLSAETDIRLQQTVAKLKIYYAENGHPWDNGLAANLTLSDFQPFMDTEGRIDMWAVVQATGFSDVTIRKYVLDLGLVLSNKYIKQAALDRTIRLEKEELEKYKLQNGKVMIGRAMVGLGHNYDVIKRECDRHGLETYHSHISQTICLDAVSKALGGVSYEQEWISRRFVNPKTGWMFKFDGYYPSINLIVEFHGCQHYTFPNHYMPNENYEHLYLEMRERDRIKRDMIQSSPDLTYFEVLEDEPYDNPDYLKGRLVQAGVLSK